MIGIEFLSLFRYNLLQEKYLLMIELLVLFQQDYKLSY
jgi:hypothetical protein